MATTPEINPIRHSFPLSASTDRASSDGELKLEESMPKVLIVQNDLLCSPCTAIASLIEHDIQYQILYAFHDRAFKYIHPLMYEAIIVLGGRAGVYEAKEIKWLKNEMDFIEKSLRLHIPIFGICLGCQLLAECIGGKVYAGKKGVEIGYKGWEYHDEVIQEIEIEIEIEEKEKKQKEIKINPYLDDNLLAIFDEFTPLKNKKFESNHKINRFDDNKNNENDNKIINPNKSKKLDPFVHALACNDMDRFILLFHGDTFSLPPKCCITGQKVTLLATTDKYNTLFRVGSSYGIQGHPELTYDMLTVWCKCWGDDFLNRSHMNLQKDVVYYAEKNADNIRKVGRNIFDIWSTNIVLGKKKKKSFSNKSSNSVLSPNSMATLSERTDLSSSNVEYQNSSEAESFSIEENQKKISPETHPNNKFSILNQVKSF